MSRTRDVAARIFTAAFAALLVLGLAKNAAADAMSAASTELDITLSSIVNTTGTGTAGLDIEFFTLPPDIIDISSGTGSGTAIGSPGIPPAPMALGDVITLSASTDSHATPLEGSADQDVLLLGSILFDNTSGDTFDVELDIVGTLFAKASLGNSVNEDAVAIAEYFIGDLASLLSGIGPIATDFAEADALLGPPEEDLLVDDGFSFSVGGDETVEILIFVNVFSFAEVIAAAPPAAILMLAGFGVWFSSGAVRRWRRRAR